MDRMMDGTKLMWHMKRVIQHYDAGVRIAPIHIDMGLSKFCNINCVFCFGIFQNPSKEYIKRDALLNMLKEAGEVGVKSIAFIGDGEPTCNPYWQEALYAGKRAGINMAISTSGVLLNTEERRKAILENCEWMRFCLAAGTKEGYLKIHRVNKFEVVRRNIESLVKERDNGYKTDIGLQSVYVPGLMDQDMIDESKLAVELGVDYFVIKQCSLPEGNKKVGDINFDVNQYDSQETIGVLKECENYSTEKTKIIPKWKTIERKGKREYPHCPAVPLISEMSGNGDWYPCGYFFGNKKEYDHLKFGNIHEKSFKEILYSERYWQIVDFMRKKFDSENDCKGSCRLDPCNKYIDTYLNKPQGINFI